MSELTSQGHLRGHEISLNVKLDYDKVVPSLNEQIKIFVYELHVSLKRIVKNTNYCNTHYFIVADS